MISDAATEAKIPNGLAWGMLIVPAASFPFGTHHSHSQSATNENRPSYRRTLKQQLSKLTLVYWSMEGFSAVLWAGQGLRQILPILGILGRHHRRGDAHRDLALQPGKIFDKNRRAPRFPTLSLAATNASG